MMNDGGNQWVKQSLPYVTDRTIEIVIIPLAFQNALPTTSSFDQTKHEGLPFIFQEQVWWELNNRNAPSARQISSSTL